MIHSRVGLGEETKLLVRSDVKILRATEFLDKKQLRLRMLTNINSYEMVKGQGIQLSPK